MSDKLIMRKRNHAECNMRPPENERESEKEGIQEDVIPTDVIRFRRSGTGKNGEPSKAYNHSAVLC